MIKNSPNNTNLGLPQLFFLDTFVMRGFNCKSLKNQCLKNINSIIIKSCECLRIHTLHSRSRICTLVYAPMIKLFHDCMTYSNLIDF